MIRALLIVVGLSAMDPCDASGDDGGTDSGPAQTVGTQCTAIITELCSQGTRCSIDVTVSDCVGNYMATCCSSGNTCDQKSASSEGDVDTCKTAIDQIDCNNVVNAELPDECTGLLHP